MEALEEVRRIAATAPTVGLEVNGETHRVPLVPAASIHVLLGRILQEMPAVGKNQRNEQQGFNFRGVDDVMDVLNPLLGKYCVVPVPHVIDRIAEARSTRNGGTLWTVHLHVAFRLYGPAGDFVEGSAWGEGTDSGDKATSKAHTMAFKYFLFELFAISNREHQLADNDAHTAPESQADPTITPQIVHAYLVSAEDRGVGARRMGELVMQATDGRTHVIGDVRMGPEREALKALIAAQPKADEPPSELPLEAS